MRKLLLSLSIGLGGLFLLISVWVFQQEAEKLAILRVQPPIKVEIVQVVCKRKKFFIRFNWKGNVLYESLPHHYPTCEKLKKEDTIEIKVGTNGKIIFADETYNGSLEKEIYLKVIFGLLIGFTIIYYLVYPHKEY